MNTASSIEQQIIAALQTIRPHLQQDDGDVQLVRFDAELGVAELRFTGACKSCSMLPMTMRAGIERALRTAVPEVRRVEAVS